MKIVKVTRKDMRTIIKGEFLKIDSWSGFMKGRFVKGRFVKGRFVKGRFVKGRFVNGRFVKSGFVKDGFVKGGFLKGGFLKGGFVKGGFMKMDSWSRLVKGVFIKGGFVKDEFMKMDSWSGLMKSGFVKCKERGNKRIRIVLIKEKQGSDVAGFGVVDDVVAGKERSEIRSGRLSFESKYGRPVAAYSLTSFQGRHLLYFDMG